MKINKEAFIPILGSLISAVLCWALIHFWGAEWYGEIVGVTRKTAYLYLMALLVVLQCYRIVCILKGNDKITKMINRWHDE